MNMIAWDVIFFNETATTEIYTDDCDAEYVRTSLIGHDGYHSNIRVRKALK